MIAIHGEVGREAGLGEDRGGSSGRSGRNGGPASILSCSAVALERRDDAELGVVDRRRDIGGDGQSRTRRPRGLARSPVGWPRGPRSRRRARGRSRRARCRLLGGAGQGLVALDALVEVQGEGDRPGLAGAGRGRRSDRPGKWKRAHSKSPARAASRPVSNSAEAVAIVRSSGDGSGAAFGAVADVRGAEAHAPAASIPKTARPCRAKRPMEVTKKG